MRGPTLIRFRCGLHGIRGIADHLPERVTAFIGHMGEAQGLFREAVRICILKGFPGYGRLQLGGKGGDMPPAYAYGKETVALVSVESLACELECYI